MAHIPVLLHEVLEVLNPCPGDFIIDGTVGEGGHAQEIVKRIEPKGVFLGIDWDKSQAEKARKNITSKSANPVRSRPTEGAAATAKGRSASNGTKVVIIQGNYANIPNVLKEVRPPEGGRTSRLADGLLLDLGFSSAHLESSRGFSFGKDEPLDMRYDESAGGETAKDVLGNYSERALAEIFWKYGEEKRAREFAKRIVEARRRRAIETTSDLVQIIGEKKRSKIHPATKVFQALRIYVNKELKNLEKVLRNIPEILRPGGRAAILTFHSLEDRIVKQHFKTLEYHGVGNRLNKKVIKPSREEVLKNPRSRSAKLRGFVLNNSHHS